MTKEITIPAYVYRKSPLGHSLMQGDILKVDGELRNYFSRFYPEVKHPEDQIKYAMVLTQSCDLVKNNKRKPKINHINLCLVRPLASLIERLIGEIKPVAVADTNLLEREKLDRLKDELRKLLNNTDQKSHFFLPKDSPFIEDMIAILSLSFSFRVDHY